MRVKKIPALALIVAAAGLSLTACDGDAGSNASAHTSASTSASGSSSSQTSGAGAGQGSGSSAGSQTSGSHSTSQASGSHSSSAQGSSAQKGTELAAHAQSMSTGSKCNTDNLGFSVGATGAKDELVVNIKNNGARTCSMHGFPGVQLIGPDGLGDTGPDAARTDASSIPTVTIAHGEETRFLLHWSPESTGATKTYTRLSVTPPNEKISEIVNLNGLNITVPDPSDPSSPDVFVDPVGYHTGSGK